MHQSATEYSVDSIQIQKQQLVHRHLLQLGLDVA